MKETAIESFSTTTLNDARPEDIDRKIEQSGLLDELIRKLQTMATGSFAVNMAAGVVSRANEQNKSSIVSSLKQAFRIDASNLLNNNVVRKTLELAVVENVNLIESIKTDFINELSDVLRTAITEGKRHTDLIALIRDRGNVSESRARLIARDQTAKINAQLTQERHVSLGIELYIWGGVGDERERDSHRVMNEKLCRYDDPAVYSDDGGKTWKKRKSIGGVEKHPGEDYQCRCVAIPYVLIEE